METLTAAGWLLSEEWAGAQDTTAKPKDLLTLALNADLKEVGRPFVADAMAAASASAESPGDASSKKARSQSALQVPSTGYVLQVTKVRNVAAPKSNEESGAAPRMLKLTLSDGHSSVICVEVFNKLEGLSISTPPGTKVRLRPGSIDIRFGFLQLSSSHIEVLGGRVESMAEKWEITQKMAHFTRASNVQLGGGPPRWVPFGKKLDMQKVADAAAAADKNFKSLPDSIVKEDDPSKEDTEFTSQRKEAIEEATKQGGKKVFGGGNKEIKEGARGGRRDRANRIEANGKPDARSTSGPAQDGDGDDRRQRRKGRGRRGDDEDGDGGYFQSKPSTGVSLFDFLEKEIPGAAKSSNGTSAFSASHEKDATRRERDGGRREYQSYEYDDRRREGGGGGRGRRDGDGSHVEGGGRGRGRGRGGDGRGGAQRQDRRQTDRQTDRDRQDPRIKSDHKSGGERSNRGGNNSSQKGSDRFEQRDGDSSRRRNEHPKRGDFREETNGDFGRKEGPPRRQGGEGGGQRKDARGPGNDRDFGEWSNSTYHNTQRLQQAPSAPHQQRQQHQQQHQQPQREHPEAALLARELHLLRMTEQRQHNAGFGQHSSGVQQNGFGMSSPWDAPAAASGWMSWKAGDDCQAKYWEDGKYYEARVTAVTAKTAVVLFGEYGNHEEVMLSDLRPASGRSTSHQPSFIPATPGLPPAFPQ